MIYSFGTNSLDDERAELRADGTIVEIQPKVLQLLTYLIRHRDRVVSKQELLDALWPDVLVGDGSLMRAVSQARRALGEVAGRAGAIRTMARRGYRFVADVTERETEAPAPARRLRAAVAPSEPFVGRGELLTRLERAWSGAESGLGRTVVVSGSAGMGKTRLARELCSFARGRGGRVITSWCYEGEGAPPYWPWVQALREFAYEAEPGELAHALGPGAAELAQLVPELAERVAVPMRRLDAASDQARFQLFDRLAHFVSGAAASRPLLLFIDDVQWADLPTLEALDFVSRELATSPVLIIAAYRDDDIAPDSETARVLAQLGLTPPDERIVLAGLERSAVGELVARLVDDSASPALVDALWVRCDGNPLFIRELVRLLDEEGRLGDGARGAWETSIPAAAQGAILGRLERVSVGTLDVLSAASLVGPEPSLFLLEAATGMSREAILEATDDATSLGLLREVPGNQPRWIFGHALIRETLRARIDRSRRRELHSRIATGLEASHSDDLDAVTEELAEHYFAVARGGGDPEPALEYTHRAAVRALAQLAFEPAAAQFERALEALRLTGDTREALRFELLCGLGEARHEFSDDRAALEAIEDAIQIARTRNDAEGLARAALVPFVLGRLSGGPYDQLLRLLEEAESALRATPGSLYARVLARLAHELSFSPETGPRRRELCERALALSEGAGDWDRAFTVFSSLYATWVALDSHERMKQTGELAEVCRRLKDPASVMLVSPLRLTALIEVGDLAAVDAEIAEIERRVEQFEISSFYRWYGPFYRATRAMMSGRLAEAEPLMHRAFTLMQRTRGMDAVRAYGAQLLTLRTDQGRFEEIESPLRETFERFSTDAAVRASFTYVLCELGKLDEARGYFEREAATGFGDPDWGANRSVYLLLMANACRRLEDVERAELLYELLLPYAELYGVNLAAWTANGSMHWPIALMAETAGFEDEARVHYEASVAANAAAGIRTYLARTHLDYGRFLFRTGSEDRARELLSAALAAAEQIGMARVAEEAREALHVALGVPSIPHKHREENAG